MGGSTANVICQITSPADGAHVSGNVTVDYFVWSTNPGGVKELGFYVDGKLNQSADLSHGFKPFKWRSEHGSHVLTLEMTDSVGVTTSNAVTVTG